SFRFFLLLGLAKREFWLGAFNEPLKIRIVLVNDQQRGGERADGHGNWRSKVRRPQEINQQRHRGRRRNRCKRNVTPETHDQRQNKHRPKSSWQAKPQENPCRRRDSFTASQLQPHRKAMSEECAESSQNLKRCMLR